MGSTTAYRGTDKLTPAMKKRVELFMLKVKEAGIAVLITETYRTPERQKILYAQGRTAPGKIVTNTLNSNHVKGEAIDVAFLLGDKAVYSGDWAKLATIGKSVGLLWGGDWKSPDRPHFEFNHSFMEKKELKPWDENTYNFVKSIADTPDSLIQKVDEYLDLAESNPRLFAIRTLSTLIQQNPTLRAKYQAFVKNK